jgi:hypothetical protein
VTKCQHIFDGNLIVDPKLELKEAKRNGPVITLVSPEKVETLAQYAAELRLNFDNKVPQG